MLMKQDDGSVAIPWPAKSTTMVPILDTAHNYELFVRYALALPVFPDGSVVAHGEIISIENMALQLSQATGKTIVFKQISVEQFTAIPENNGKHQNFFFVFPKRKHEPAATTSNGNGHSSVFRFASDLQHGTHGAIPSPAASSTRPDSPPRAYTSSTPSRLPIARQSTRMHFSSPRTYLREAQTFENRWQMQEMPYEQAMVQHRRI
ncbi:hypothetical protein DFH09DRAFT_623405 [Mycena vulgaris]|nr:hypothetical protein DFH09DRAFT_623405 [Mycena vulgaris]